MTLTISFMILQLAMYKSKFMMVIIVAQALKQILVTSTLF